MDDVTRSNDNWIPTKKFFPEAILLGLLTGAGYLAAFAYQYGYLSYFGAPILLVDVTLNSVLLTTASGLMVLLVLGFVISSLITWESRGRFSKFFKRTVVLFVILSAILIVLPPSFFYSLHSFPKIVSAIIFFVLISACVYMLPLKLQIVHKSQRNKNDLLYKAEQVYGSLPVTLVLILILFITCSAFVGKSVAERQSTFLVSKSDSASILIGAYSGDLLITRYDINSKFLTNEFSIISRQDLSSKGVVFSREKIGPLLQK